MNKVPIQPIKNLIICSPYKMPDSHWHYDRTKRKFEKMPERRSAGFLIATSDSKTFDDPGKFVKIELVNEIRAKVNKWRENGYPNVTGVTKQLLEFWIKRNEKRLFFCQIEAIETIIWCTEVLPTEKNKIKIESDSGEFERLCTKMATGTGKTVVMAMLIVWQVINKATYPNDNRFSKNILIIAPGITIKKRLEVLKPKNIDNYYDMFQIVPDSLWTKLYESKIVIHNWHTLTPLEDEEHSVVKKGVESDLAFSKRILGFDANEIIVINDEAHHAWRKEDTKNKTNIHYKNNISTRSKNTTSKWIEGLDKIHEGSSIIRCHDFSATPFIPTGKSVAEEMLFKWIVSDFSLNDAIESGLTKTPRIAIRDDSGRFDKNYKSRFYHIYVDPEVKSELNRKTKPEERLPDLITNAYMLLGQDWLATKKLWDAHNKKNNAIAIPPVMITISNKTKTSERVECFFKKNGTGIDELSEAEYMLRIDTAKLREAEKNSGININNEAEKLRQKINNVGKHKTEGEQLRNIIAVQMITEGWDARNVTHIMGLRAFTSQLLCEQTVGRGLRRMSYDINTKTNFLDPEYVNIFGVPFTFLPHEGSIDEPPSPPPPTTLIEPDNTKYIHEISWPNIDRINIDYAPTLEIDWAQVGTLKLRSDSISTAVGMAQVIDGKPHVGQMSEIDLYALNKKIRLQTIVFNVSKEIYNSMMKVWKGSKEGLLMQIVNITEEFIRRDKIHIVDVPKKDKLRTRLSILFNMQSVVRFVCNAINEKNIERKYIMLNLQTPIKSTGMMRSWYTKKLAEYAVKNHINLAVYENSWEVHAGNELERNNNVISWVKNDHIGFVIKYSYKGITHDYYPDFLIKLNNSVTLVLEIKGRDDEQNKTKRKYLKEWIDAVNEHGKYGSWAWDVAFHQTEVRAIIEKHVTADTYANINTKCPACNKSVGNHKDVEKEFGFRNIDGITRPQSWCKECRSKTLKENKQR